MEATVTTSYKEYSNLKKIEDAVKSEKCTIRFDYCNDRVYVIDKDETLRIQANEINSLNRELDALNKEWNKQRHEIFSLKYQLDEISLKKRFEVF